MQVDYRSPYWTRDAVHLGNRETLVQQLHVLFCRRSQVIEKFEALDIEKAEHMETNMLILTTPSSDTRQGRSERRAIPRKRVSSSVGLCGTFGSMAWVWGTHCPICSESHTYKGHVSSGPPLWSLPLAS